MRWQPRRFRTLPLLGVLALLATAQLATYLLVSNASRRTALAEIEAALERGATSFSHIASRREDSLLLAARTMAGDYAMRQLFLGETFSPLTARSALESYQDRIGADLVTLLSPDGPTLTTTLGEHTPAELRSFDLLRRRAVEGDLEAATGYAVIAGQLQQIVIVPVLAPPPEIVAWIGIGFPIGQTTAAELASEADLAVSFVRATPALHLIASTLAAPQQAALAQVAPERLGQTRFTLPLRDDLYVTRVIPITTVDQHPGWIVLQRSLTAALGPTRRLERVMLVIALATLGLGALGAVLLARNVSHPVQALARHTRKIAAGDYATRLHLARRDELGELALAFNRMSDGLAERDRVRDLLDKNVSPAVAAQLLRDGAALGGEEREVTILFADLRGFTTLSEALPPRALVALLNRYLDCMSQAIEAHGGVIDKFIGDAIMALYGAPLASPESADRALRSALALRAAIAQLNRELATEGIAPLAIGVGINTGRVIAGNMGSQRRLNYTVVGDGVNIAARLQALTRDPAKATDILLSEATRMAATQRFRTRDLGAVPVKGRSGEVRIHALDGLES